MSENFRLPRTADDQVLELAGAVVKVTGTVEGLYQGRAVVQFPVTGGALGVATTLKGLSVDDSVALSATVVEATRDVLKVRFDLEGGGQTADLVRSLCKFI